MSERLLVLVRHGQSEWNLKNLFTGWKDPDLTELGVKEATEAGRKLKAQGPVFDVGSRAHGAVPRLRRRLHLGPDARAAHARSHPRRARPEGSSDPEGPCSQRA